MKNKGFTLVELLAVIAILGLLISLSVGIYFNVQENILEGQYNNVVGYIENKAEEYANDTGVTGTFNISVEFLISEGYLIPDDNNYIYDPRNKDNILNCYMIHVILKNGEYIAKFGNKYTNEDGTCDDSNVNTNAVKIMCNGEECSNDWYGEDVTLSISGLSEEALKKSKIEWSSLTGYYELQESDTIKSIVVSPKKALYTTFSAMITTDDKVYNLKENIKIDREKPMLISKKIKVDYDTSQQMTIDASDMNGSGLEGYALTKGTCADATYNNDVININESGNFNLCLKDYAGNINESAIKINKVIFNYKDESNPSPTSKNIYYMEGDTNYALLHPKRNGYTFDSWVKKDGVTKVNDLNGLNDNEEINATWKFNDVDMNINKINKNSMISNLNVIFVLDVSGSMSGNNITNLKKVSINLIDNLYSSFNNSSVSIIEFDSTASILLSKGNNANEAKEIINSLSANGGTSFSNALSKTKLLIERDLNGAQNNYVIFVSDGYGNTVSDSLINGIKALVSKIYSIGIGSNVGTDDLIRIASENSYFNSTEEYDSLSSIFSTIENQIKEEVIQKSSSGYFELPNLYVTAELPFILTIKDQEHKFNSISEMNDIITIIDNKYYLDLCKVDNKYKLNGDLKDVNFVYYYDE